MTFQSTRPRGRTRLSDAVLNALSESVSIHASSREDATSLQFRFDMGNQFQSTRTRGRTRLLGILGGATIHRFNPRVLAGGRDECTPFSNVLSGVSIHASSREDAT